MTFCPLPAGVIATVPVMDGVEHLLAGGSVTGLVTRILDEAPGAALLVTSRERLNLRREWVYDVPGLPLPPDSLAKDYGTPESAYLAYPAVALFVKHAQRVVPGCQPQPGDWPAVARICRAVDGLPLGIELAATWLPTLSPSEIAVEIEEGIDFLSVCARDVPERHRSMRAVFDHSWQLLSSHEQQALRRLSVFCGGFTRQAAEAVAGASLASLSALIGKSLLRRAGQGPCQTSAGPARKTAFPATGRGRLSECTGDRY